MKLRNLFLMAGLSGLLWGGGARAEYREWTIRDGTRVTAEYVQKGPRLVVLRRQDGSELKIDYSELSEKDQQFVELRNPPRLDIKGSFDSDKRTIGVFGADETYYRLIYEMISPSVTISKSILDTYSAPLVMELVIVGQVVETDRYIVLDHVTREVRFTDENEGEVTFETNPIDLQRTEGDLRTGIDYYGYVIAVRDYSGEIIGLKAKYSDLRRNAAVLLAAEPKTLLNRDFEHVDPKRPNKYRRPSFFGRWF